MLRSINSTIYMILKPKPEIGCTTDIPISIAAQQDIGIKHNGRSPPKGRFAAIAADHCGGPAKLAEGLLAGNQLSYSPVASLS